uniref:protein acetyllysine N-acetyltransferase n=1 Tax=Strigamia maritima TaxID=126957 RepID=T1JMX0_STRMM
MALKGLKIVKGVNPFHDAFFVHRRYVGLYDDLECEDINTGNKKFLIIYRKATFVAPKAANSERIVPLRPARIVVEEDGNASFQVLFRVFRETSTTDEFCELLKQLSAVGGFRLCCGLDERDVNHTRASTVMHFLHPFERMEARGCLLWFSPKYRRKPLVNNLMSRCPRCSVWTSHTKYQKKRSREESEDVNTQLSEEVEIIHSVNSEERKLTEQQEIQVVCIEETVEEVVRGATITPITFTRQDSNSAMSNVTVSIQSVREVIADDDDKSDSSKRQKMIEIQFVENPIPQEFTEDNDDKSANGQVSNIGWAIASDINSMINWNSNRTRITMNLYLLYYRRTTRHGRLPGLVSSCLIAIAMASKEILSSGREHRKRAERCRILVREEVQAKLKSITTILKKSIDARTSEDLQMLENSPEVVDQVEKRMKKRTTLKEREKEIEDPPEILREKCKTLAEFIRNTNRLVIYTGAGISTAASIPDYRGPNGVWTLMQKGKKIGSHELSDAEPTTTHMVVAQLYDKGILSHVVSQNCDGLHMRSGLPWHVLSEVHGNMYMEVCIKCRPTREYIRLFDVTERTSVHKHKTGRKCYECGNDLIDTIVHFGEKGLLKSPLNWLGAVKAAEKCDMILCLGSSLKVLRKYTCLWEMNRPLQSRPVLCVVNLQWTPKDHVATLKINGKCDEVMVEMMKQLQISIPRYHRDTDPIFQLSVPLREYELPTVSRKPLASPFDVKLNENETKDADTIEIENIMHFVDVKAEKTDDYSSYSPLDDDKLKVVDEENEVENSQVQDETPSDSETKISGNPGWFGKGYRKIFQKKRRRL